VASEERPAAPKPGPPPRLKRWFQERPSEYPWEQDGLDHVRRLMPHAEPYRAWATFSFTAASGRINECDLLIAVPGGLYLVELKGHPGRVVNIGETWSFYRDGSTRERTLRNPLHLTDLKSKELKGRLEWAARQLKVSHRVPRVEPAVFLSAPGLDSHLDDVQSTRVFARDDDSSGLPWIWRDLLAKPPQRESQRVTPEFSRHVLPKLLEKIGIRASTAHLRFGDDWKLATDPLDAGPTWEDRLAERNGIVREEGRVRIYLTELQAAEERKQSVERAARREYQVLQGITHRGIAQAVEIREHQGGPAILFRHRASDLRLDSYLAVFGDQLTPEARLDMVRQLGEAMRYAHSRSLYHRALAARSVYVSAKDDGSSPVLRVIDWQSAARDFDTTGASSLGNTSLGGDHIADAADVYLAPEFYTQYSDPVDLDVFGLGAVSYLIVTGQPPATDRAGLVDRVTTEGGLHPYAVADSVSDALDSLIYRATRADVADRLASADAFLETLDLVEQDSPVPGPASGVDPLTAMPGQLVGGDWMVERVLGTGATARVMLVSRPKDDEDDQARDRRVLKVALDEAKADRLHAEAAALDLVGGGAVVRLLDGPRVLGDRTVLDLEYAGDVSLGARLRAEGRLTYHELERYGADLFTALDQLAREGIRHRDLKPDNFGILRRADRSKQLMLFDFSLHGVSERDVKAGTAGYIDPFLDTPRRPVFDDHAERYAAAVTLHEMASTARPIWGDGITDPRTTTDQTPTIAVELFEPALSDGLNEFFLRAFHRDVNERFDTLAQMENAWRAVFTKADAAKPATTPATVSMDSESVEETRDAHAAAAELSTSLEAAGLSPRAVSVAQSFGATTVSELLDVPLHQIAKARGAGAVIRKELNRRHKQWTAALRKPGAQPTKPVAKPAEAASEEAPVGLLTVDDMAERLAPPSTRKGSSKADVVRLLLGLADASEMPEWPTQNQVAKQLGITQASVSRHQQAAVKNWVAESWLDGVREELVETVTAAGRVMTVQELAVAVRARHGAADDSPRRVMVKALAVVRAAVEAETWAGLHPDQSLTTEDSGPRLAVLRRSSLVLVACESLLGTDDPSAPELAEYAVALGRCADQLVEQDPLPGRGVVLRELRAVAPPDGLAPFADTRLVALAAVASKQAAGSPRLELYPRRLGLAKALRIAQAGAGVRRESGISADDLLSRVRARFPELEIAERLTHVQLEEALKAAGFPLEYDTEAKKFRPPAPESSRTASASNTSMSAHSRLVAHGLDPLAMIEGKLAAKVERGGFLALTLRGKQLPGAAELIAHAYPVREVPLNQVFLAELRDLVTERGQDWGRVLAVDARFSETGQMPRGLNSYVLTAWTHVVQRLTDPAASGAVLFVHDAGLLGRYYEHGGHDALVTLQQAARRPADVPHGLWLLCPAESPMDTPQIDGRTVEVLDDSERVVVTSTFLEKLRGEPGSAA
jgi:serine/threonine protein kinase